MEMLVRCKAVNCNSLYELCPTYLLQLRQIALRSTQLSDYDTVGSICESMPEPTTVQIITYITLLHHHVRTSGPRNY